MLLRLKDASYLILKYPLMCLKRNNYNIGEIVHRTRTFMGIKYKRQKRVLPIILFFLVHGDLLLIFLLDVTAAMHE